VADTKPDRDDTGGEDAATEELVAYLDGELDAKASESLKTKLSLDPKLRAKADALQRAWDILDVLPRPLPSPAFASRTMSQVIPTAAAPSGTQVLPYAGGPAPSVTAFPAARPGAGFWLGSAAVILAAALGGYLAHKSFAPAPKAVSPEPPLEDLTLMKNLRLYRNVEDMDYLKKLDSPELFGDDSE
jgi:anti-sigma factor RsiW